MSSERARESRWTAAWCAVALAFPWSNAFMSVAAGCLGLAAILDLVKPVRQTDATGDALTSGLALAGLVLLSGLSSLWSEDAALAWNDVRIKLPLLVGGLVLLAARGGAILSEGSVRRVVHCAAFSAALATAALIVLDLANGAPFGGRPSSVFISHIRLGLWWAVLLPWAVRWLPRTMAWLFVGLAFVTWFWTESLSGMLCGLLTAVWWVPALFSDAKATWPGGGSAALRVGATGAGLVLAALALRSALPDAYPDAAALPVTSAEGNAYVHKLDRRVTENGHFVWTEIAWGELAESWKDRHALPFDQVQARLIRFLASKGLSKDRSGVQSLSQEEIDAIAGGATSVVEWNGLGWSRRWNRMKFNWGQWLDGMRTSDASILARSVYQQAAVDAVARMPWPAHLFGVGSGGSRALMSSAYADCHPRWPEDMRHRPHNQWLSLWIQLGMVGCALLVLACRSAFRRPWGTAGVVILLSSFLFEDTLETQAGVTLAVWVLSLPAFIQADRRR